MDTLASSQLNIGREIEILNNKYRNEAPEKKTVAYLENYIQHLNELWNQFEANNQQINLIQPSPTNHLYFQKNYYESVKTGYECLLEELMDLLNCQKQSQNLRQQSNKSNVTEMASTSKGDNNESPNLIRRQLTLTKSINNIIDGININQIHSKSFYELKLETIKKYWSQIEDQHNSIFEQLSNPSDYGYTEQGYFELENKVQEIILYLLQGLETFQQSQSLNQTQSSINEQLIRNQEPSQLGQSLMKLPKITIPKFNGNYLNWRQFHDLYTQMVHNQALSNAQKMWYLTSNLTGEAEKLIKHLSISDENYITAWEILNQRYNNKRLIVTTLIDKLLSQPTIATESSVAIKNLHDTTKECLLSLENLGLKIITYWDPFIVHLICKKLDRTTHNLYEQSLKAPRELQSINELLTFLETRFQSLEALGNKITIKGNDNKQRGTVLNSNSINTTKCINCKATHAIYNCSEFLKLTPQDRQKRASQLQICLNCLKHGHNASKCVSRSCLKCNKKHNTLLHFTTAVEKMNQQKSDKNNITSTQTTLTSNKQDITSKSYVFLGTALAAVKDRDGTNIKCRVLLDSGSQLNFITDRLRRKLNLANIELPTAISGIGKSKLKVNSRINITISSNHSNYSSQLEAYVIKEITARQPHRLIRIDNWNIPPNIKLADPEFNKPQEIDMLLGAELYGELMRMGQVKIDKQLPILQNTTLGWIVLGRAVLDNNENSFCGMTNLELNNQLQKFWHIEEYNDKQTLTLTEQKCEEYFKNTVTRDETGRFIVSLPILSDTNLLQNSENIAFKRLISIENKLSRNPELRQQYCDFMAEYLKLNHMEEVKKENITAPNYFLPHHYVLKPSSSTTKLRVVFDASAKTATNLSLNDLMLAGPKVQDDLISIILRFRMKRYVFTADIKQMYRQIKLADEDRNLHLIMWRNKPSDKIKYYRLCTVTYGTKSAPYLATRCLQQLAEDESTRFHFGLKAIRDFYVDDVITGSDDLDEAVKIQTEIQLLLKAGGFELHKWCANHPELIKNIPNDKLELQLKFQDKEDSHIKTLGLLWHPVTDYFSISADLKPHHQINKRTILADTAQIYDPLGLINPVVVTCKIFLQDLWKSKIDWDDELTPELQQKWTKFIQQLPQLTAMQIPRHVLSTTQAKSTQLHIFSDASERAYGAAVYVRSKDKQGQLTVRLLCAKSRVAPVKPTTLPRLELCGAKLAANLADKITKTINHSFDETIFWTDSQIVLSWIKGDPAKLKTFVANRVTRIQELTEAAQWRYVPTKANPADLISRGALPDQLLKSEIWLNGPEFLHNEKRMWPSNNTEITQYNEEEKSLKFILNVTTDTSNQHPVYNINHSNSFGKLQRVMAYVLRAVHVMKNKDYQRPKFLTTIELEEATREIVREVQRKTFKDDIKTINKTNQVASTSKLLDLTPFIDNHGLLRVGGRIEEANIPYDAKHPLLLPGDHFVSKLIYNHVHNENLHAGPQALNSIVRQRYWILRGRDLARSTVANCVRCTRIRPRLMNQIMGNLPASRVQQARPFYNCGVDFCGPFYTHFRIRGKKPLKTYIAVFCCFTTKATHLEVVSDLTTEGFIGALKRFIARRGKCQKIFCDNGKNFVGAKNQLQELQEILTNNKSMEKIANIAGTHSIQFNFIPPRSPHFGGLWEAAVKSTKYLLLRSTASAALTYEELCTVTAEVESILNSRPITAASSDPNDLSPLTPAHFIIGEPLTSAPDPFSTQSRMALASRWALVSQIREEFWKRWYMEYLHLLQKRAKWAKEYPNLLPGTLVLVKEDNQPPLKWQMGRIVETINGPDGKVRVADIKTSTGIYRRAIHNLAPLMTDLPDDDGSDNQMETEPAIHVDQATTSNEPGSHNQGKHRRKRHNTEGNAATTLKVLLLTSMMSPILSTSLHQPIQIQQFTNNAGVYFENLGNAMIIGSEWKMVVYYNLKTYWAAMKTIEQGIQSLNQLTKNIKNNNYQIEIVQEYQHQLHELKLVDQLLLTTNKAVRENRFKRSNSPFNFIGSTLHSLIGLLDDDYAQQMSQTINNVKQNEDHLLYLIKNQTSVIETTVNIMKKSEEEKINQIKLIYNTTEIMNEKLRNMNIDIKQETITQGFNTLAILCNSLMRDYTNIQRSMVDIITTVQHGRISPLILSPNQLREQLTFVRNHIPSTLRLPIIEDRFNLLAVYQLLNVHYHLNQENMIFLITMPLVRTTIFELYKIYPLPVYVNNTFVSINTTTSYIIVSPHRDQSYQLSEFEIMKSILVHEELYIVQQNGPMKTKGTSENCELQLFTQISLPSSCKLKKATLENTWIALTTPNHWLYSMYKEHALTFVCQHEIIQRRLQGTGLLIMVDDCAFKDDEISISSSHVRTTKLIKYFQPAINLSSLTLIDTKSNEQAILLPSINYSDNTNLIRELDERVNLIKIEQQNSLKELQPHEIHQFVVGYTTIIIIIVIVIYLFVNYWKYRSKTLKVVATTEQTSKDFHFEVKNFKRGQHVNA